MMASGRCEECRRQKKEVVSGLCWMCKVKSVNVPPIEVRKR